MEDEKEIEVYKIEEKEKVVKQPKSPNPEDYHILKKEAEEE